MSQENVEASSLRAVLPWRFQRGLRGLTDDFEFVTASEMPDAGTYRGQEARDWIRAYIDSFDGYAQEATEILDAGDKLLVAVIQHGRPRGSDMPVESRWWQVTTFRSGNVTRIEMFSERAQALDAAGLSE